MGFRYEPRDEPDDDGHRYVFYGFNFVSPETVEAAEAWCAEKFGPNPENLDEAHGCRWWGNGDDIYFRDEIDAFQFRMRWC